MKLRLGGVKTACLRSTTSNTWSQNLTVAKASIFCLLFKFNLPRVFLQFRILINRLIPKIYHIYMCVCVYIHTSHTHMAFLGGSDSKESACNAEDPVSIPGLGRSPGEGNGYPLQYACLEISMSEGPWQATFAGSQSPTGLRN